MKDVIFHSAGLLPDKIKEMAGGKGRLKAPTAPLLETSKL